MSDISFILPYSHVDDKLLLNLIDIAPVSVSYVMMKQMSTITACLLCLLTLGDAQVESLEIETGIAHGQPHSSLETEGKSISLQMLETGFKFTIDHVKAYIKNSLLASDGLSLNRTTVNLEVLEALCDPAERFLVGNHCRKQLSKGDCSANVPCKVLNWVNNEAPDALSR